MSDATTRLRNLLCITDRGEALLDEALKAARAAGYAEAKEQAVDTARIAHPGTLQGRDRVLFAMGVRAAVDRIRAMQPEES